MVRHCPPEDSLQGCEITILDRLRRDQVSRSGVDCGQPMILVSDHVVRRDFFCLIVPEKGDEPGNSVAVTLIRAGLPARRFRFSSPMLKKDD